MVMVHLAHKSSAAPIAMNPAIKLMLVRLEAAPVYWAIGLLTSLSLLLLPLFHADQLAAAAPVPAAWTEL